MNIVDPVIATTHAFCIVEIALLNFGDLKEHPNHLRSPLFPQRTIVHLPEPSRLCFQNFKSYPLTDATPIGLALLPAHPDDLPLTIVGTAHDGRDVPREGPGRFERGRAVVRDAKVPRHHIPLFIE